MNKYEVYPGGVNYQLGTYHLGPSNELGQILGSYSPGLNSLPTGVSLLGIVHSHPGQPTPADRRGSLSGDTGIARRYLDQYPNARYNIYFANNGSSVQMRRPSQLFTPGTIYSPIISFKF